MPPRVRPGDLVSIVAPAGPVRREPFAAGLAVLSGRYRIRYDDTDRGVFAREGLFAGDDARRADELNAQLRNPDVRAIFCARGGHGVLRILSLLDADALRRDPKPIVGFSDITLLLAWALAAGVRGIHGPVVTQLGRLPAADQQALVSLLESPAPPPALAVTRFEGGARTRTSGPLVGGNLEVFSRLAGTPWAPALDGVLFFAEDVDERPYRIDRLLTHLGHIGLARAAGAVFGDFTHCDPAPEAPPVGHLDVLRERMSAFGLPAGHGLPIGHGERNVAVPYGARATLDLDAGRLVFEEGAVS